ncbi:lactonase family protein [Glaciihabitans tibetensis]|uniref:lactonase family protein n=1 Tax=Glaciihabitans tibetensis TaxID=1266600 RepID=UPI0015E6BAE1|nr:beta-propeller fold lactonase family protein [Glaciihabitans tibetensis]
MHTDDLCRRLWVGGYTAEMDGSAAGIGLIERGPRGELEYRGTAAITESPSFLGLAGGVIYATGESGQVVSAFRRDGSALTPLGQQPAAGPFPCALAVVSSDRGASHLVVASYGDGAIGVFPLDDAGSVLPLAQALRAEADEAHDAQHGPHEAQDGPHAHDVLQVDASTVLTTDLGTDCVYVHTLGSAPALTRVRDIRLAPGTGPRDLLLRPSGDVWVVGELSCQVVVLRPQNGEYSVVAQVQLPGAAAGDHASAIAVNSAGTHAYVGLRGSNRVATLRLNDSGALEPATFTSCGGDWPRHLVVVGEHLYVANQRSGTVSSFAVAADGALIAEGAIAVPSPTYLLAD